MRQPLVGNRIAALLIGCSAVLACSREVQGPKPTLQRVSPAIICNDQFTTEVKVEGEALSPIPIDVPKAPKAALPTITLLRAHDLDGTPASNTDRIVYSGNPDADKTNAFDADGKPLLFWDGQMGMRFVVDQQLTLGSKGAIGMLPAGIWDVQVQNPTGQSATSKQSFAVVDKPAVDSLSPAIVCLDQAARTLTLSGQSFLRSGAMQAALEVDGVSMPFAATLSDCTKVADAALDAEVCRTGSVELAQGSVANGFPSLTVRNPETAACKSTNDLKLRVVPAPKIDRVSPPLGCVTEEDKQFVIEGAEFLTIDGVKPKVTIDDKDFAVDQLDGCEDLDVQGKQVQRCSSLTITVAKAELSPALYTVSVANPEPAGCNNAASGALRIVPPPSLTGTGLALVCVNDPTHQVTITGSDFLVVDGTVPSVNVDGQTLAATAVAPGACTDLSVAGLTVRKCDRLVLSLPQPTVSAGMFEIEVTNPAPADCSDKRSLSLSVVAPPTVASIDIVNSAVDDAVCDKIGFSVIVHGSGFAPSATVTFRNSAAKSVTADDVTATDTALTATFSKGLPFDATDASYDLIVSNAGNCTAPPLTNIVTVNPAPLVFFVDPAIVYNAISVDATVFTSGLSARSALGSIALVGPDGAATETSLSVVANDKPNRIVAHIPGISNSQPTFSAGSYAVKVTSTLGCSGELPSALRITDTTDNALLTKITPSFVSSNTDTAVTISGAGLQAIPRVYLTPSGSTGSAQALRAVTLTSATQLSAVVPSGLTAGPYNVILVNPDGKVGVLSNGVTATAANPPAIDSVVPASLVPNASTLVTISGRNFDVASVQLECKASSSASTITSVNGSLSGSPTAALVTASFDPGASGVAAGSICLLKLTNHDGAFYEYSAVSLTNSSLNLSPWSAATKLTMGRRALSLVAGRPTGSSRFLYAIGGDSGVSGSDKQASIGSTVFDSVESANVDVFGSMGAWSTQPRSLLPARRTWAGAATIGHFIYLVGGHNGSTATNTLYRAEILDPLGTTDISDLNAVLSDGVTGLNGGLYYYGVAAIFPSDNANNPGGESLTGELLPVTLPARTEKITLTLTWNPLAGAHGYRIYRSPTPGAAVGSLQLLAEKTCGATPTSICDCTSDPTQCRIDDAGTTAPSGNGPLAAGSLGKWHAVTGARCSSGDCLLTSAREGLASVAVPNPSDANTYYLYAIGGRNDSGTYLNTYEVATVTLSGSSTQTVADWTAGSHPLSSPRAELGAWVVSASNSNIIRSSGTPNNVWVYLGGGRTSAVAADTAVEAGQLQAGGDLGTFVTANITSLKSSLTGFGVGASNDRLYTFGGLATAADGSSASLCGGSGGGCAGGVPDLPNNAWNSLGNASMSRMYMGAAQESAFFFVTGGWFNGATLSSTEQTVQ